MGIVYENRPYIIVKQLRVRDLRDDDIVLMRFDPEGEPRWIRWDEAPHWFDEIDLIDVQVLETPPSRRRGYPPGQDPRDGMPLKKSS